MKRNKKFYNGYKVNNYFIDIANHSDYKFINFLQSYEQNLIINSFSPFFKNVLIIGMGYGREIDIIKKLNDKINIDVIDFNENFIDWGKNNYKNVSFFLIDLDDNDFMFNFDKYDFVICFNTLEYIDNNNSINLINLIMTQLNRNSVFLFRILSKDFIQINKISKQIEKRTSSEPVINFLSINHIMKFLSKYEVDVTLFKQPIKFEGYFFKFLYSKLWNIFSYFESLIRFIIPKRMCRGVYFKCLKK